MFGKQCRLPLNKVNNKEYIKRPLQEIHSDGWGPAQVVTPVLYKYLGFIDDYTLYCVVFMMYNKS